MSNADTQERLRALARKLLAGRDGNGADSGALMGGSPDDVASVLRSVMESETQEGIKPRAGVRVISKHDVDAMQKIMDHAADLYRGTWSSRTVAIRMLPSSALSRDRFETVTDKWWKLSDPNVLPLLGVSDPTDPDSAYTVTPYCERGNLVQYLRSTPELGDADILQMMTDIASGLEYLHEKGIAHGNLQGKNVLVESDLNCLIGGFFHSSFANPAEASEGENSSLRSEMTMWYSPEILASGDAFTPQGDMYAFAIVCTEILTKGVPFSPEPSPLDTALTIVRGEHRRPALPPSGLLDGGLKDVIDICWADAPGTRPASGEVRNMLRDIWDKLGYDGAE
ncbi:kinase-like protein [Dentipellis sp. KUC8613]|nr:kinase-like protein [Dentipellis sp. KUC8613]